MKKILIKILPLLLFAFMSTACSIINKDSGEVKVIPKTDSQDTNKATTTDSTPQKDNTAIVDNSTAQIDSKVNTPVTTTKKDAPGGSQNSTMDSQKQSLQADTEEYIKSIIMKRSSEAVTALKEQDLVKLSQMVDPKNGVRFSPYGHVSTKTDLTFTTDQLKKLASDQKKYTWGIYDGSGEPIQLTFKEYYNKFIYDKDFINAKEIGYNKILGKGNTLINTSEVYPKSIVVEYYFPGFDPQYQGMDWRSLRMVFQKQNDTWYLVGIIHDQWTT